MPLWKVTLRSYFVGDETNPYYNVFGYKTNTPIVNEVQELADRFRDFKVPAIATVVVSGTRFDYVAVENIGGGVDYAERTIVPAIDGERTGPSMPRFVAAGFEYRRDEVGQRSGAKRFGRVAETDVSYNDPTGPYTAVCDALALILAEPIQVGLVDIFFPVILERPAISGGIWGDHGISGVLFKRITTQNSRKR